MVKRPENNMEDMSRRDTDFFAQSRINSTAEGSDKNGQDGSQLDTATLQESAHQLMVDLSGPVQLSSTCCYGRGKRQEDIVIPRLPKVLQGHCHIPALDAGIWNKKSHAVNTKGPGGHSKLRGIGRGLVLQKFSLDMNTDQEVTDVDYVYGHVSAESKAPERPATKSPAAADCSHKLRQELWSDPVDLFFWSRPVEDSEQRFCVKSVEDFPCLQKSRTAVPGSSNSNQKPKSRSQRHRRAENISSEPHKDRRAEVISSEPQKDGSAAVISESQREGSAEVISLNPQKHRCDEVVSSDAMMMPSVPFSDPVRRHTEASTMFNEMCDPSVEHSVSFPSEMKTARVVNESSISVVSRNEDPQFPDVSSVGNDASSISLQYDPDGASCSPVDAVFGILHSEKQKHKKQFEVAGTSEVKAMKTRKKIDGNWKLSEPLVVHVESVPKGYGEELLKTLRNFGAIKYTEKKKLKTGGHAWRVSFQEASKEMSDYIVSCLNGAMLFEGQNNPLECRCVGVEEDEEEEDGVPA